MGKMNYRFVRIKSKLLGGNKEIISNYFRKKGCIIGEKCNIGSDISTSESYLIEIGTNVTISSEVLFITHDASVGKVFGKERISDLCGKITIGDNCFIGARCTILYGVELGNDTIVAAGSVVTKSFLQEKIIIGGNPAKIIGDWNSFKSKSESLGYSLDNKSFLEKKKEILDSEQKIMIQR